MRSRNPVVLLAATAVVLASCSEKKAVEPAPAAAPAAAAPAPVPAKPVVDTASVASVSGKSDPECVGPLATGVAEKLSVGNRALELNGYRLKLVKADADDTAVIGVIANANEASPENLANLDRYLKFFEENGVELVVVAGDSGDDRESIEAVLRKIARTGTPTVAIAGNREPKAAFVDAVNAVRKNFPNLVNGNRVRRIDWDDVDLVTLPGYHDPRYIHAAEAGCQYFQEDVDALATLAAEADHPVLLVAHGAPKGDTPDGLDAIAGEKPEERRNVGDPNLRAVLASAKIPFGIFPNIKEAGGRAFADVGGNKAVPQGQPAEQLYLNPGSADSLPWTMNDGTTARGMAAVVTVKGNRASYRLFQAPATVGPAKGETAANQ
jgi:Icc-related predicted phosphoesterase